MNYQPVLTKKDFVKRYQEGEFGNRSPTWDNIGDFLKEPHPLDQLIHIRNRVKGGPTWDDVTSYQVEALWRSIVEDGIAKPEDLYLSYMAPTDKTVIQGELMITESGLELYYTKIQKPMRRAFRICAETAKGLLAKVILGTYVPDNDQEWLHELLVDRYPGHVVEFSTYSVPFGTERKRTVIWEVRKY